MVTSLLPFRADWCVTLVAGKLIASSLPLTMLFLRQHGRCEAAPEPSGI